MRGVMFRISSPLFGRFSLVALHLFLLVQLAVGAGPACRWINKGDGESHPVGDGTSTSNDSEDPIAEDEGEESDAEVEGAPASENCATSGLGFLEEGLQGLGNFLAVGPMPLSYVPFDGSDAISAGTGYTVESSRDLSSVQDRFQVPSAAARFNGRTSGAILNLPAGPWWKRAFSAALWVKVNTNKSQILFQQGTKVAPPFILGMSGTQDLVAQVRSDNSVATVRSPQFPLNAWTFVAMIYDGSVLSLYVGNTSKGQATLSGALKDDCGKFYVGTRLFLDSDTYDGAMDSLRIYNRVLAARDVNDLYNEVGLDVIPPETTVQSGPAVKTNDPNARFVFTSNETNVVFNCRLDAGIEQSCAASYSIDNLSDGNHTLSVVSRDRSGNVDGTPATHAWAVDTVAPETSLPSGLASTIAGRSLSLVLTSNEAGSTFECSLDGAVFATCPTPQVYRDLANGIHVVAIRAKDQSGNVDASPVDYRFVVDNTAPFHTYAEVTRVSQGTASVYIAADDDNGVAAYCINETGTAPTAVDACWAMTDVAATSFESTVSYRVLGTQGIRSILYIWFKDVVGNVSPYVTAFARH